MKLKAPIFTLLVLTLASVGYAQRAITPADTLRIASVSDAQISPDGNWVVYSVSTVDGNRTRTTLWLTRLSVADLDKPATEPRTERVDRLLAEAFNASNPRWSPDGKRIAFLAGDGAQRGIWIATLADRKPRFVTPITSTNFHIAYAGESFAWSPDSRRIAFINATEAPRTSAPVSALADNESNDPRVVDRIQYKSRTSFSDRLRTHVWVVDVDAALENDDRGLRQLTSGTHYDHALTWSPKGDEVAFLSNHEPDPDANNNSDIFAVDMGGRVRQITDTKGCEYEPTWSPDGKWIAYTATKRNVTTIDSIAEDAHVWMVDAGGGPGREISARLDRRARNPRWMPNSRTVLFLAGDGGQTLIHSVGIDGGRVAAFFNRDITGRDAPFPLPTFLYQVSGFSLSTEVSPVLALTVSSALRPAEVWIANPARARFRPITSHNSWVRELGLGEPQEVIYKSFDGTRVQGWLIKPIDWREDRRYPMILSIHGGPHGMYGVGFNATFQVYAASGYAVLYLNPRGSSGYGQKFSDGTLREWGGGDFRDLMVGVDAVLRTRPWIDPDRLGVTGGSYGGYMTNWVITQTPRFKAAVAAASVSNLISFYSTSLYQDLIHAEFGGFPWDDYDLLWRWSPLKYVKQAQTPTLFIHGELDNDVHITQAEEMYTALKRRGVETVLVRYPREGHGLREPNHRLDALERTIAWFDRFMK